MLRALCLGCWLAATLSACSDTAGSELEGGARYSRSSASHPQIIDARAAAKLSLIGTGVDVATDSHDGAIRCAAVLRIGGRQLAARGLLPGPQLASVRQAQGYYEALARTASASQLDAGLQDGLKRAESKLEETPSEVYPLMYSCIRNLASRGR